MKPFSVLRICLRKRVNLKNFLCHTVLRYFG